MNGTELANVNIVRGCWADGDSIETCNRFCELSSEVGVLQSENDLEEAYFYLNSAMKYAFLLKIENTNIEE